jgi:hypothetical protein
MSDEPKKRSHTTRLVFYILLGMFTGGLLVNPAVPWSALCILVGALAGLAVELFFRSLETADQIDALHSPSKIENESDGMKQISSFMSLTTSVGAILGFAGSVIWLAIRLAIDGMPKQFWGEGLGWAVLFAACGAAIGLGIGLFYAFYKLWMNEA